MSAEIYGEARRGIPIEKVLTILFFLRHKLHIKTWIYKNIFDLILLIVYNISVGSFMVHLW